MSSLSPNVQVSLPRRPSPVARALRFSPPPHTGFLAPRSQALLLVAALSSEQEQQEVPAPRSKRQRAESPPPAPTKSSPEEQTFWQRAWQGVQFYLVSRQQDAGAEFPPFESLSGEEQHALRQLLEPVRQAEVAKAMQQLARLSALDTRAPAVPAEPQPMVAQQAAQLPASGHAGASLSAAVDPHAAQAAQQQLQDALAATLAPPQAARYAAAAAAGGGGGAVMKQQALPAGLASLAQQGTWGVPWPIPLVNLSTSSMFSMPVDSSGALGPGSAGDRGAAAEQQPWGMPASSSSSSSSAAAAAAAGGGGLLRGAYEGFSMRSPDFVGVYRSRRAEQGWRAQFSFANKVINLGTYDAAEDAARVWNEAALLLRGEGTWLSSVEPLLPAGHVAGELHLTSQKAAAAVRAAAESAGLPEQIVLGVKVVAM